tara:strand:- start:154 stop:621 length:468 start_codon:yes stop_codon:yes gene_type:complete
MSELYNTISLRGGNYSKILEPNKNKWFDIKSKKGKLILIKYLIHLGSGWGNKTYKSYKKRKEHNKKCMKKKKRCYLYYNKDTNQYKFPICPLDRCEYNCDGILAAKKRAALYKYDKVKKEAQCFGNKLNCKWAKRDKILNDYINEKCSKKNCICA